MSEDRARLDRRDCRGYERRKKKERRREERRKKNIFLSVSRRIDIPL